jgi:hypothetical protein
MTPHKQIPSVHCFLPWQTVPQAPQLALSLLVFTHAPLQRE